MFGFFILFPARPFWDVVPELPQCLCAAAERIQQHEPRVLLQNPARRSRRKSGLQCPNVVGIWSNWSWHVVVGESVCDWRGVDMCGWIGVTWLKRCQHVIGEGSTCVVREGLTCVVREESYGFRWRGVGMWSERSWHVSSEESLWDWGLYVVDRMCMWLIELYVIDKCLVGWQVVLCL